MAAATSAAILLCAEEWASPIDVSPEALLEGRCEW